MGRPSKRTPENATRIEQAIAAGATYRLAAQCAGMNEDTLLLWRASSSDFSERLARAEAQAGLRWLAVIDQAIADDWRAAAWKLEHRFPDEYGRAVHQLTGDAAAPLRFTLEIAHPTEAVLADGDDEASSNTLASPAAGDHGQVRPAALVRPATNGALRP